MRSNDLRFLSAVACTVLSACADSTGPAARPMSVSFTSTASTAPGPASSRDVSVSVSAGADQLTISSAELVLARIQLDRVGAACSGDEDAGDGAAHEADCEELELAPGVVSLPLNGTVASAITVDVPAGSYSALEAKIRAVRAKSGGEHHGGSAFLAAHPDLAGVSVRVKGTFNGSAFTYTGAPEAKLEFAFAPALVIDASGTLSTNVTVNADVSSWFRAASGALIDPSTANAGGPNAGVVSDNVRRSFRAYRDDDRDGKDDGAAHR